MRRVCLVMGLVLVIGAGVVAKASAAEPVLQSVAPEISAQSAPAGGFEQNFTPAPEPKAPITYYASGPCSVTVTCRYSPAVSCSSPAGGSCLWQNDYSPTYPGFVTCGSYTARCQLL